jgi:hypothetical protein
LLFVVQQMLVIELDMAVNIRWTEIRKDGGGVSYSKTRLVSKIETK